MANKRRPATGRQLDRAPAGRDSLGLVRFGSRSADYFRATIRRPWFAHYLHGKGDGRFPEAQVFESGANEWRRFDSWPPKGTTPRRLYLRDNGRLAFGPPARVHSGVRRR